MGWIYFLILGGLGLALVSAAVTAWLKGTLYLVRDLFGQARRQIGEPWTIGVLLEPVLAVPAVFVVAAVGLAHPESRWARWFYGEDRLARSRRRFES